eukprot:GFKZ01000122.1.p1 GENE.GFKZ01000122.1~~GFKZ01000122.1.p1  ORF type:complete len:996 (-),score=157.96 GFKZ01000122.1:1578-4565(-)
MPHMFGNYSGAPPNSYPQINAPPPHMQRPQARHPNPNMNLVQPPYPPQFQRPPQRHPPQGAPPSQFPQTRPREWDNPENRSLFERDNKRMRPFPPNSLDNSYHNQNSFNSHNPTEMPPQNSNMGPSGPYNSQQQHRNMLQHNPIHPPNQEALSFQQQRQGPFPHGGQHGGQMMQQFRGPMNQQNSDQRGSFNTPFQTPSTNPLLGPNAYERLPAPPRKEIRQAATDVEAPAAAGSAVAKAGGQSAGTNGGDEPMSFKDFLLRQPDNISSHAAQEAYDEYVKEFTRQKPNKFFDMHKDKEWFKERYHPDYVSKRIVRIEEECQERGKVYRDLWDRGGSAVCAPVLTPAVDGGKTGSRGSQTDLGQSSPQKKESEASALPNESDGDGNGHGQDNGSPQGKASHDGIKAKPAEDSTQLSAADGHVEAAAKAEDNEIDESPTKQETATEGTNEDAPKPNKELRPLVLPLRREHQKDTIFMRGIPLNHCREDLTRVLKSGADGSKSFKLLRLKLGDINPQRNLERFGWAVYDSEETAARALEHVRGVKVISPKKTDGDKESRGDDDKEAGDKSEEEKERTYVIDCMLNLERRKKFTQGRVLPSTFGSADRMASDVTQSTKMMRRLDSLRKFDENLNPLTDEFLSSLEDDARRLDHIVTYLREVHYFCYYSGNEFLEDPTSMPPQELRPTSDRGRHMSEADNRLLKRIDERAKWVLDRDYDRPRSNSDNSDLAVGTAIRIWLDAHTKNEGQGRYRCGLPPNKLFKGPEFVHKHLRTKHADKMKIVKEKAILDVYRANFENDASKEEVIKIYYEGLAGGNEEEAAPAAPSNQGMMMGTAGNNTYGQQPTSMPMGMYNPYMGMGMQPFPLMMNPATGYGAGYPGNAGYANPMAYAGRGMNTGSVAGSAMNPGPMMHGGGRGGAPHGPHGMPINRRPPPRRDGPRDGGPRGRRPGPRRGMDQYHRGGHHGGRPSDPRAGGHRRAYNDLDAPSNTTFDLVRYDDV